MKTYYYNTFLISILILVSACTKENLNSGINCRPLYMMDNKSGTQQFEYDDLGMVKLVKSTKHSHTTYSQIIRDHNGLMTESFKYYDNTLKNKYSYTYEAGQIVKIDICLPLKTTILGSYYLKYDINNRIIEIRASFPPQNSNTISTFQYNDYGACIQYDHKLNEQLFYRKTYSFSGTPVKAFTSYLKIHGLPMDINEWTIYPDYQETEGSITKEYSIQANSSNLDLIETSIIKSIQRNADGSIREVVRSDEQGIIQNKVSYVYDLCK